VYLNRNNWLVNFDCYLLSSRFLVSFLPSSHPLCYGRDSNSPGPDTGTGGGKYDSIKGCGYMLDERVVKMEDKIGPVYANTPDRISAKRHTVYGQTI
jgi:hypothetical protein